MDEIRELRIDQIRIDGGTQTRSGVRDDVVAEYAELMKDADNPREFPPILVVMEPAGGTNIWWLSDGFHRLLARKAAGFETVKAKIVAGTRTDAILLGAGANAFHGLRRSDEDKRAAVRLFFSEERFAGESDRWIAEKVFVSRWLVGDVRRELGLGDQLRLGKNGRLQSPKKNPKHKSRTPAPTTERAKPAADGDGFDLDYGDQSDAIGDDLDDLDCGIYADDADEADAASDQAATDEWLGNEDDPVAAGLAEAKKFDAVIRQVTSAYNEAKKLADGYGGAFLDENKLREFRSKLQNAAQVMRDTKPHCVCTYCGGNGLSCKTCRSSGYLPKILAADAPEE